MALEKVLQIRLSMTHWRVLKRLSAKLGVNYSNVMRVALSRLAEQEKIIGSDADRG